MPEYLSPGVYIEEVNSGPRPIEGVGTAMAAFVGLAPAGPANEPDAGHQLVAVRRDLRRAGGRRATQPAPARRVSLARVYGYFLNGGGRCYVTRIVPGGNGGDAQGRAACSCPADRPRPSASLTLRAKDAPKEDIEVEVDAADRRRAGRRHLHAARQDGHGRRDLRERQLRPSAAARTSSRPSTQTSKLVTRRRDRQQRAAGRARAGSGHLRA